MVSKYMERKKKILSDRIKKNTNKIWKPKNTNKYKEKDVDSWFDIKIQNKKGKKSDKKLVNIKADKKAKYKCKIVELLPTKKQRNILRRWFNSYTTMYNETIQYIINNYKNEEFKLEWKIIRNAIKNTKHDIYYNSYGVKLNKTDQNNSKVERNYSKIKSNKNAIPAHTLDRAIQLAVANYKSALTNYKNGNIKKFRIRKWKYNRDNLTMGFDSREFKNNTLCGKSLGIVKAVYDGQSYDLNSVSCDTNLGYNAKLNKYCIYVPEIIDDIDTDIYNRRNYISMDPGIRTFMTCISDDKVVHIGTNASNKIKNYLERIDNTEKIKNIKRRKNKQELYRRKISNLVDELHWKTINYLVTNNDNILIGDMSIKSIISCENNLNKMTKRIGSSLRFYQFKQRLKYKCSVHGIGYKEVDESYTSKMCSVCGEINDNLGSKKIYDCPNCPNVMDRDVNGARCIFLRELE